MQCMGRVTDQITIVQKFFFDSIPSPYFTHLYELVFKDRGLYRHYGLRTRGVVYHLNTGDILKSALSGTAQVHLDPNGQAWIPADQVGYRAAHHLLNSGAVDMDFSFDSNCETWARSVLDDTTSCQSSRLKWCLAMVAAAAFMYSGIYLEDQSPGMFTKVISSISNHFYKNLENVILKTVIRTICRIVCYLILYCHSPNLLTTGVLVALISMDVMAIEIDSRIKDAFFS